MYYDTVYLLHQLVNNKQSQILLHKKILFYHIYTYGII